MPDRYDSRTALLVVDVQNDFADPQGGLYVAGGEQVVPVASREAAAAAAAGGVVIATQDWHPPQTPHFVTGGGEWPVHCVADTWGAELHPDLQAPGERVRKGTGGEDGYSGFTVRDPSTGEQAPTALERLLREREVDTLVVVGIATDVCVKETVLDAVRLGFSTTVLREGVRAVEREAGDGERALRAMAEAGATVV